MRVTLRTCCCAYERRPPGRLSTFSHGGSVCRLSFGHLLQDDVTQVARGGKVHDRQRAVAASQRLIVAAKLGERQRRVVPCPWVAWILSEACIVDCERLVIAPEAGQNVCLP